jgi:diguanylate cyclase (GGDEF)-like protein
MQIRQALHRVFGSRLRAISVTVTTVCLVALSSGGLVGILASQAYDDYTHGQEVAAASGRNVAKAMASHASGAIRLASTALDFSAWAAESGGLSNDVKRGILKRYTGPATGLKNIILVGADGKVLISASGEPGKLEAVLHDVITPQPAHSAVRDYVAKPVREYLGGEWVIPISRPLSSTNGERSGSIVGLVPVSDFSKFYSHIDLGQDSALELVSASGMIYSRFPVAEGAINADFGSSSFFQRELKDRTSGTVILRSAVDGVERLYSYARVGDLPLVVLAGVSVDAALADWSAKFFWRACGVGALFACLLLMGFHIQGRIRKSEEDEARLNKAHIELEELNHELEKLVMLDPLTGLGNRRRFDQGLPAEFSRAMRNGSMLALIMIDVDFFKKYNDLYGHPAGDDCLRIVSAVVQASQSRPGDLAVRYGGEEMAVLLPHTDLAGARTVAEKIRQSVEKLQVRHDGNPCGVVTVSIGVNAFVPVRYGHTKEQLIESADKALYEAKATGRNKVCCGVPIDSVTFPAQL